MVLIKTIAFSEVENAGWEIFWDAFKNGNIYTNHLKNIVSSTTFLKSLLGAVLGGFFGYWIYNSKQTKK